MTILYPKVNPSPEEIASHLKLARDRIRSAEILLREGKYRDAISRAYYAFFDAASALLLTKGLVAKTHAGLLTLFGLYFVKKGKIKPKFARFFRKAKEAREEADYEVYKKFSKGETETIIGEAKEFVKEVEKTIKF
ncbi:HEPN domain-containing protein [bacterium]|nr:HEPN domain-containing protein [bacterium]